LKVSVAASGCGVAPTLLIGSFTLQWSVATPVAEYRRVSPATGQPPERSRIRDANVFEKKLNRRENHCRSPPVLKLRQCASRGRGHFSRNTQTDSGKSGANDAGHSGCPHHKRRGSVVREPLKKPLGSEVPPNRAGVYATLTLFRWLPDREWSSHDRPTQSTSGFHKCDG
jgi:hypothetical protein